MEKIWYLFLENHHKGPFSAEEIFKMFHSDQINSESLIWRQGLPKWLFLKDCQEIWDTLSPKEEKLPVLPVEEAPFNEVKENEPPVAPVMEEELPETPSETDEEKIKSKKAILGWIGVGLIFCGVIAFFFLTRSTEIPHPYFAKELSLSESERLRSIANVRLRDGVKVGFSATGKNAVLYMATNREGPAILTVQISSIPRKILSRESIVATAETKLEGHYAVFKDIKFLSGTKFLPGQYNIEFLAKTNHPQREWINKFIRWGILSKEEYSEKFVYKGELLMAEMPASRFQEELEAFYVKAAEEAALPYIELKERYGTLISFADQLFNYYNEAMKISGNGFDKANFEKGYASELGHFFQAFIEDSEKNKNIFLEKKSPIALDYMELQMKAADVGALIGEMLAKTVQKASGKKLKIKDKTRTELLDLFSKKVEKIKSEFEAKRQVLDQKILEAKKI